MSVKWGGWILYILRALKQQQLQTFFVIELESKCLEGKALKSRQLTYCVKKFAIDSRLALRPFTLGVCQNKLTHPSGFMFYEMPHFGVYPSVLT